MSASHEYERLVLWGECDPANIIFFPNYARWVAEGLDRLMAAIGVPHGRETKDGWRLGLPAVRTVLDYKSPARLYDTVLHRIEIAEVGRRSILLKHTVTRDETVLMSADDKRVLVEFSPEGALRSIDIPPEIRTRFSAAS